MSRTLPHTASHTQYVRLPGGAHNGASFVEALQKVESNYVKGVKDVVAFNEANQLCCSAFLRLKDANTAIASHHHALERLQSELSAMPVVAPVWDNREHRKAEIQEEIARLDRELAHLEKIKEKELNEYSTTFEQIKAEREHGVTELVTSFSREDIKSCEKIFKNCLETGQRSMKELKAHGRTAQQDLVAASHWKKTSVAPNVLANEVHRSRAPRKDTRRRSSSLSHVDTVEQSFPKSIRPTVGTYRKCLIYSGL
ncbi:uncharacterized protein JCM6883_001450 [Sporobolomyces salmoneus]|uniref:uncharacterized protein n=1 Tax=Sporobolomyces salmoneus TaxID=183962 RepID=UPI0031743E9C